MFALIAWCLAHKLALLATVAVLATPALALEALLMSRASVWLRVHAPRVYAALHVLYAMSPQIIRAARMLLAIWRPALLDELDAAYAAIMRAIAQQRITPADPLPVPDLRIPPHERSSRKAPPLFCLALLLAVAGCGAVHSVAVTGTVSSDGGPDWTAGVGVVITMAEAADPVMRRAADADGQLTPDQHTAIDTALRDAADVLAPLDSALGQYERIRDLPHQCQLRASIDAVIEHRLQVIVLFQDFGIVVPPIVPVVVGALGSIADALLPGCVTPGARVARELPRIRAVLARGSAR